MACSGKLPSLTPAELRKRVARVRSYARDISDIEAAEKLREFATELEARAAALEAQVDQC